MEQNPLDYLPAMSNPSVRSAPWLNEVLAHLVTYSDQAVVLLDQTGRLLWWNTTATALARSIDVQPMPDMSLQDIIGSETIQSILAAGSASVHELTLPNGVIVTIEHRLLTVPQHADGFIHALIAKNITLVAQNNQKMSRQEAQLQALFEVTFALIEEMNEQKVMQIIVERVAALLQVPHAIFDVFNDAGDGLYSIAGVGTMATYLTDQTKTVAIGQGFVGYIAKYQHVLVIPDYDRWEHRVSSLPPTGFGTIVGWPLLVGGSFKGVLTVAFGHPNVAISDAEEKLLARFVRLAEMALHNAQQYKQLQVQNLRLAGLQRITTAIIEDNSHIAIVQLICELISDLLQAPEVFLVEIEHEQEMFIATAGLGEVFIQRKGQRIPTNRGLSGQVLSSGKAIFIADYQQYDSHVDANDIPRLRSATGFPLKGEQRPRGVLMVGFHQPHRSLSDEESLFINTLGRLAALTLERHDTLRVLNEQNALIKTILSNINSAVIVIDGQGIIIELNERANLLGSTDQAIKTGDSIWDWSVLSNHIQEVKTIFNDVRSSGVVSADLEIEIELSNRRAYISYQIAPILRPDQQSDLFVLSARDVSNLKRAEQRARLAQAEAEQASRYKTEFLSRVSHELRTPLTAILGFAELMQYSDDVNNAKSFAQDIHRAGKHLLNLINEVLDISRIELGQLTIELRPVSLKSALTDVINLAEMLSKKYHVSITFGRIIDCLVLSDERRLKQILLNILSNSIKYNKPDGSVKISVSIDKNLKKVSVSISDTGIGMTKTQLDHLFEPFNRLGRESTAIEGAGIGLAVTKGLVELMSGSLEVQSQPEKGSTFTVVLPLVN
jgi:PAS domain S-box-containing protein